MGPMRACAALALAWINLWPLGPGDAQAQELGRLRSSILVMDAERLFEDSKLGQQMLADHQAEREDLAARNRKLEAELEAEELRLTGLRATTSPEEFSKLTDAFDTKVQEIRRDSERRVRDLERERERLPASFLREVEPIMLDLMREAGGVVLLDARTVIFRADAIDLTDSAIARIDARFSAGEEDAPQAPADDTNTDQPD